MKRNTLLTVVVIATMSLARSFTADQGAANDSPLSGIETMISMRDGVRLYTRVYAPKKTEGPVPIILLRTPYGTGALNPARIATALAHLVADGYIFVQQDIRGRFKSDGAFVMLRQPRDPADAKAIDEGTDTYDTIQWLLANVPNHNGRVGIAGTSYGAWLAVMAMLDPHPALKAVVPQASPADMWIGDDFHQATGLTGFKMTRPTNVQRSEATVRTSLVKSTSQSPPDEVPPAHSQRASHTPALARHFRGAAVGLLLKQRRAFTTKNTVGNSRWWPSRSPPETHAIARRRDGAPFVQD